MDVPGKKHANFHSDRPTFASRQVVARLGEECAAAHLKKLGCVELERNWHSGRFGEIDLIMRSKSGDLVFVEVKTRRLAGEAGFQEAGFNAINWRKRRKILIAARAYMHRKHFTVGYRCDAVLVEYEDAVPNERDEDYVLRGVRVLHVESAFDNV